MDNRQLITELREILAEIYLLPADARRIAADAGLSLARISFGTHATNIWDDILREAIRVEALNHLLELVIEEYPNQRLINIHEKYRSVMNVSQHVARGRRPIPDDLPYLVNRHEQEDELAQELKRSGQQLNKPVLCVTYGDKHQCHDMFVNRLERISLPSFLNLDPEKNPVTKYELRGSIFQSNQELHEKLELELAREICNKISVSLHEINLELAQYPGPVLLYLHLYRERWQPHDLAVVEAFLQFWQQWPSLLPGQHLFICLCIKHGTQQSEKRTWFLPWNATRKQTDLVALLTNQLSATVKASTSQRLLCVLLSQLNGVTLEDVEYWARNHAARVCGYIPEKEFRALYERWERRKASKLIPMEQIAKELTDILTKYME